MVKIALLLSCMLAVMGLSACSAPAPASPQELAARTIQVVATTGMVGDLAAKVGGERVEVTALMGPGVDPHLYKASESDVRKIGRADIIFYTGLHLEAGMGKVFDGIGVIGKIAVPVGEGIPVEQLLTPAEFAGSHDPHVWFDVKLWSQTIPIVRDALSQIDPGSADLYASNAEAYQAELAALDAYIRVQASRVPETQRVLITAHDAFNYFGRAYGFEVRGLQGISTATEAGTADVAELAEFIAERQIPAVFIESSVPQRNVEAVQAAVQARGFQVRIGGELFSDAMGDPGTTEGSYVGMVRHNIDTIVNALLLEK
jgi:manganese/zinc/iron transport system substrate-binding protein